MKYTKHTFEMVARIMREAVIESHTREAMAREFAREFQQSNPRFDRGRFLAACEGQS